MRFDYDRAFSRNQGWITAEEQCLLKNQRIAIAGLGGVGGSHLLTLARLGVGKFNISDLDTFELANFNRQAGAFISTLEKPKLETLRNMALDINPELQIQEFPQGINEENIDEFLDGVDLYVDGLDFFALSARKAVFAACERKGIPAVTAAPLGMGSALLNFLPGRMGFETYFRLDGRPEQDQITHFLLGLSPAMIQRGYLVDPTTVDFLKHKGPSTPMACELCAGMAATQALKILLHRGPVICAPRGLHFDNYRNKLKVTWRPGGNNNPIQQLGLRIAQRQIARMGSTAKTTNPLISEADTPMERIIDLARWAPSGDNTQPWEFETPTNQHLVIHGKDTRDWCVYDLEGHASQLALGALLETIVIAASAEKWRTDIQLRSECEETAPVIDIHFTFDNELTTDPLIHAIRSRTTQRQSYSRRPLMQTEVERLEASLPEGYRAHWFAYHNDKLKIAKLLFDNAKIRLTIPEAFEVHRRVIEWDAQFSTDRIPDQALGISDKPTLKFMKWAMRSWERIKMLNRYMAGTLAPRIRMDLLPAINCAAHCMLIADKAPESMLEHFSAGRAIQRFWLAAASQGLSMQPETTPLIFSQYVRKGIQFTQESHALGRANRLSDRFDSLVGSHSPPENIIFMSRLGRSRLPTSRSTRLPAKDLLRTT